MFIQFTKIIPQSKLIYVNYHKEVILRLTDEKDEFFWFQLKITEEDFQMYELCGLLVCNAVNYYNDFLFFVKLEGTTRTINRFQGLPTDGHTILGKLPATKCI